MGYTDLLRDAQGQPLGTVDGPQFAYSPATQGQPLPLGTLAGGLKQFGGGTVDLASSLAGVPLALGNVLGLTPTMSTLTGQGKPEKPKKINPTLNDNLMMTVKQAIDQGALPDDPATFLSLIGEDSKSYGLTPSQELGVLGRLAADTTGLFPERAKLEQRQHAILQYATTYAGLKLHAMQPALQQQATLQEFGPKTTGQAEQMGASPLPDQVPYAPGMTPLSPGQSLLAFDEAKLNLKPRPDLMTPEQIVQDARLQRSIGNIDDATLQSIESQASGGLLAAPQPATNVRAGFTAAGARAQNNVSVAEQQSVLQNMVAAGQLDPMKYQQMQKNLMPMNKTVFDTFLREMTGGANSATTKGTNELAEALFGKPYDQLGADEQITPTDRKVIFDQFGTALPHGPMTRRLALSRLKVQDIPRNIQTYKTDEQIRAAGPMTYNRGDAELDLPLGGSANTFRRLLPSGEIETAPTTMSHRTANELGYVDVSKFKQDIQAIPDLEVLEAQTRELEKYATELIKADSGIGRFVQGGKIAINKLTQGGKPTNIPKPDGSPGFLTVGEAANLYDTQVQSMLEYYARNLRGVRGAATEGDVGRMQKAFASVWDSKTAKEQKFKEVYDFMREVKDASVKTVFGKTVQHLPDLGTLSESEAEFARKSKSLGMSKASVAEEIQRRRRR